MLSFIPSLEKKKFLILDNFPAVLEIDFDSEDFYYEDTKFSIFDNGSWNEMYDILVNPSVQIVGLRICDMNGFLDKILEKNYVQKDNGCYLIYFHKDRNFAENFSDQKFFLGSEIFFCEKSNVFALSFGSFNLIKD